MIRVDLSLAVLPSLLISAIRSPACIHENDLSQAILVNAIRPSSGNQAIPFNSIRIREISLISRQNNCLSEIISSKENNDKMIQEDSAVYCIRSIYKYVMMDNGKFANFSDNDNNPSRKICISKIKLI